MADLLEVLPGFEIHRYRHLLHSLRKNSIVVTDLITLDPLLIAKRCPLPLDDVRCLIRDVLHALRQQLLMVAPHGPPGDDISGPKNTELAEGELRFISTLDTVLDATLGGGFPLGYLTEIVGESAVGKTQFALCLLLSVQLPAPLGFGKSAIYIGTEAPLNTRRLEQILETHPHFQDLAPSVRPSFDRIHCMTVHDLQAQQSIIDHHLQRAVQEYNAGLVVIDSMTANFRAYHDSSTSFGLAKRAADLFRTGAVLRRIAQEHRLAVVVTNQVSDRFVGGNLMRVPDPAWRHSSPASSSSIAPSQSSTVSLAQNTKLTLDYQQDFFTGWGSGGHSGNEELKNPALGLAWANQLSARVVLKLGNNTTRTHPGPGKKGRTLSLVFSPWSAPTQLPVTYSIEAQGVAHVPKATSQEDGEALHQLMWDPEEENEEFP